MTDISHIRAAAKRLDGRARKTPLLSSSLLDDIAGRRVLVKAECLQHTGSFKFRGGWSAISALDAQTRARGVIAFSSGNHAQGVGLAARMHNIPAIIIMPSDAPRMKIENTRAYGAEVVLYDRHSEDRDAIGERIAGERGLSLIRPFDDPHVIAGQGTVGLEIAEQTTELGIMSGDVLVPCGGGGLTSGIALALASQARGLQVRTCEPEGLDDAARSLVAGAIVSNPPGATSICDAILTPQPGRLTFPIMHELCAGGIAVSDAQVCRAMALAFTHLKLVVEPGGAVALAAALFCGDVIEGETVIAVASGGNVDLDVFARCVA